VLECFIINLVYSCQVMHTKIIVFKVVTRCNVSEEHGDSIYFGGRGERRKKNVTTKLVVSFPRRP